MYSAPGILLALESAEIRPQIRTGVLAHSPALVNLRSPTHPTRLGRSAVVRGKASRPQVTEVMSFGSFMKFACPRRSRARNRDSHLDRPIVPGGLTRPQAACFAPFRSKFIPFLGKNFWSHKPEVPAASYTPGRGGTRNAARRPGSGGRPRGCGFEEQGGACTRIQRGSISIAILSVCLFV